MGTIAGALTLAALFGERGVLETFRFRTERDRLRAEIAQLETEIAQLEAEIEGLEIDPRVIERIAREELGLALPGEALIFLDREEERDPRLSEGWKRPAAAPVAR